MGYAGKGLAGKNTFVTKAYIFSILCLVLTILGFISDLLPEEKRTVFWKTK